MTIVVNLRNVVFYFGNTRFFYSEIQRDCNFIKKDGVDTSQELHGVNGLDLPSYLEIDRSGQGLYKIKDGWHLHLYISQLPCELCLSYFLHDMYVI